MVITDSTLRHNLYDTVYNTILVGTSSLLGSTQIDVRGGYPDLRDITFPIITIPPINVSEDNYTIDSTRNISDKEILINTIIFTNSNQVLDKIADGLSDTLRNNQISGVFLVSVSEADNVILLNEKVRSKTLTFTYKRR